MKNTLENFINYCDSMLIAMEKQSVDMLLTTNTFHKNVVLCHGSSYQDKQTIINPEGYYCAGNRFTRPSMASFWAPTLAKESYTGSSKNNCIILSCFADVGKNYAIKYFRDMGYVVNDIEKTNSINNMFGSSENFVRHINDMSKQSDILFIPYFLEMEQNHIKGKVDYYLVYPSMECKRLYLKRFQELQFTEQQIRNLSNDWVDMINDCRNCNIDNNKKFELSKNDYVLDVINEILGMSNVTESYKYNAISNSRDIYNFKKCMKRVFHTGSDMSDDSIRKSMKMIKYNNKVIGYVGFSYYNQDNTKYLGIGNFMILPEYQRSGYGTKVINDIIEKNKSKYDEIYCYVDKDNTNAINFYKKIANVNTKNINDDGYYYVSLYKNGNMSVAMETDTYSTKLNRNDIIKQLKWFSSKYPKKEWYVSFKAALVLYGVETESNDIDLYGTPELCDRLIRKGFPHVPAPYGGRRITITDRIEIFDDVDFQYTELNTIEGINIATLDDIESFYKHMNREKDQETLRKIREYKNNTLVKYISSTKFSDVKKIVDSLPYKDKMQICTGTFKESPYVKYRDVLIVNSKPVSFIEVYELPQDKGVGYITIATRPEFRGRGYSSKLINIFLQSDIAKSFEVLAWKYHDGNDKSYNLAKKFGFDYEKDNTLYLEPNNIKIMNIANESLIFNEKDLYYNKDKFDSGEANVLLITGFSGSGKSTLARQLSYKYKCTYYELDCLSFYLHGFMTREDATGNEDGLVEFIDKKRLQPNNSINSKDEHALYKEYIQFLINWCKKQKNKRFIIEGLQIYETYEEGDFYITACPMIIKGTSGLVSSIRAAKRNDGSFLKEFGPLIKWVLRDNKSFNKLKSDMNKK